MRTKIFATRTDLSSASQPAVRARATAGRAQQRRLRGGRARLCRLGDPHDSSPRACAYPCLTGPRGSPHPVRGTGAVVGVGCDVCGTGERFERRPRRRQRSSATGSGRPASRRCSARRKARSGAAGSAGQNPAARGERAGFTRGSPSAVARCAPWMAAVARPCGPSGSSARGRCVGRTAEDVRHCPTNQRQRRLGLIRGRQCELQRGCLEQNSWPLGSCSRQHRGRHERNGPAWRRHSARTRCSASAPTKNKRTFEFVKTNTVSRY